jgi:hypothetical protein
MRNAVKRLLVVALALPALLFTTTAAFAGNPAPPSTERIIGPPIEGVIVINSTGAIFIGECKKQPVLIALEYPYDTTTFTEADLMNYRLDNAAPAGCFSAMGGENLIITGVQKFVNYTPPAGADPRYFFPTVGAEIAVSVVESKAP